MTIEPSILYLGTPVVLISTHNEDGSSNEEIVPSRLAAIEEKLYRMPDVDLARSAALANAS